MTEEHLEIFKDLFIDSVNHVAPAYMRTVYGNMGYVIQLMRNEAQARNLRRYVIEEDLVKTGERIFCYELYHQLRSRMEPLNDIFDQVYLQGELKKVQVMELLELMDLEPLSGNYIPDFLLHTPGNADDHPYVIEVKTDAFLSYPQTTGDIKKIIEFLTLYHYQKGIFLSINTSDAFIRQHFMTNQTVRQIPDIENLAQRIFVINREDEYSDAQCRLLSELF